VAGAAAPHRLGPVVAAEVAHRGRRRLAAGAVVRGAVVAAIRPLVAPAVGKFLINFFPQGLFRA